MILFQEVIDEMYIVLKQLLPAWRVYRRPDSDMIYYVVTAVRCPRQSDEDDAGQDKTLARIWARAARVAGSTGGGCGHQRACRVRRSSNRSDSETLANRFSRSRA